MVEEACKPIDKGQQEEPTTPTKETREGGVLSESRGWNHTAGTGSIGGGGGVGLLLSEVRTTKKILLLPKMLPEVVRK